MNAYNEATIAWMAGQGATHVCLPTELPSDAIAIAAEAARRLRHRAGNTYSPSGPASPLRR